MTVIGRAAGLFLSPFQSIARVLSARVSRALAKGAAKQRCLTPRKLFSIPLIEHTQLSSLYFAIQIATRDDQDYSNPELVAQVWLKCILMGQLLSDRLLMNIRTVELNLDFWQNRLKQGNNRIFLAISRGPITFFRAIKAMTQRLRGGLPPSTINAAHRIEQRIVTLRTMHEVLTATLARLYYAARQLRNAPALVATDGNGQASPTPHSLMQPSLDRLATPRRVSMSMQEVEEGATARTVGAGVLFFSTEVLEMLDVLKNVQAELDLQKEGTVSVEVSGGQPVLLALAPHLHAPQHQPDPKLESVTEVPDALRAAEAKLNASAGPLLPFSMDLAWLQNPEAGMRHMMGLAEVTKAGPLLRVPVFALAPSRVEQHWVQYSVNATVALMVARFLVVNSPLAGSNNLQRWVLGGYMETVRAVRDNVVVPLSNVRSEFFDTFHTRATNSQFSREDFEASKASLQRMLDSYAEDVLQPAVSRSAAAGGGGTGDMGGGRLSMERLMEHYEQELRAPIRSAFVGHLPRSLLIQVHKMKTDTEAAMVELDQIMKSNELTMAVTAALPAMFLAWLAGSWLLRLLFPAPPNLQATAAPVRVAMGRLERAIDAARSAEEHMYDTSLRQLQRLRGTVLLEIAKLRARASALYRMSSSRLLGAGDTDSWESEGQQLDQELIDMAMVDNASKQARIAERMQRTYLVFRA